MSASNNPSAFPVSDIFDSNGCGIREGSPGMTLRDWFAGQAIGAVVRAMQRSEIGDHIGAGGGPNGFAATAYDIADAMLVAREQSA